MVTPAATGGAEPPGSRLALGPNQPPTQTPPSPPVGTRRQALSTSTGNAALVGPAARASNRGSVGPSSDRDGKPLDAATAPLPSGGEKKKEEPKPPRTVGGVGVVASLSGGPGVTGQLTAWAGTKEGPPSVSPLGVFTIAEPVRSVGLSLNGGAASGTNDSLGQGYGVDVVVGRHMNGPVTYVAARVAVDVSLTTADDKPDKPTVLNNVRVPALVALTLRGGHQFNFHGSSRRPIDADGALRADDWSAGYTTPSLGAHKVQVQLRAGGKGFDRKVGANPYSFSGGSFEAGVKAKKLGPVTLGLTVRGSYVGSQLGYIMTTDAVGTIGVKLGSRFTLTGLGTYRNFQTPGSLPASSVLYLFIAEVSLPHDMTLTAVGSGTWAGGSPQVIDRADPNSGQVSLDLTGIPLRKGEKPPTLDVGVFAGKARGGVVSGGAGATVKF